MKLLAELLSLIARPFPWRPAAPIGVRTATGRPPGNLARDRRLSTTPSNRAQQLLTVLLATFAPCKNGLLAVPMETQQIAVHLLNAVKQRAASGARVRQPVI